MLNMGIIGAGLWGQKHAHVFSALPQTRVAAVCDQNGHRAEQLGAAHGQVARYEEYRRMLDRPDIDAVSIATPDSTHPQMILDALSAGKHVLTEKPLATTLEDAHRVAEAAEASDRVLMVDFHNRVNPAITAAQADLTGGHVGEIVHGSARLSNTSFVPLDMLRWASQSSALWFLGSHLVDALRFLLGDEVCEVYACRRDGVLRSRGVDTADVHLAILKFAKGAVISTENSWVLSPDNPQIFDMRIELVGQWGQIQLNPSHNGAYQRINGSGLRYEDLLGITPAGDTRVGGYIHESIARFVDSVVNGAPVLASAHDGLRCTQVLSAIEDSARSGQPVTVQY